MVTRSISVSTTGKNIIVAYLLWWFLGVFSIHRFYLNRMASGLVQLGLSVVGWILVFTVIGALIGIPLLIIWGIWWVFDAYFVYKYVEEINRSAGIAASAVNFTSTRT